MNLHRKIRTKEFNEKLMLAVKELEEFKAQREKHENVLEEIRKQRDTYKQLLVQQQGKQGELGVPNFVTSTPGEHRLKPLGEQRISDENLFTEVAGRKQNSEQTMQLEVTTAALQKLQKQFEVMQKEMMATNR